jgi:hypothetical protein
MEAEAKSQAEYAVPTEYFVVSDRFGFVGAFHTVAMAEALVVEYFPTPFIVQRFPAAPNCQTDVVWAIPFRDIDAVAFVSNSREDVVKVQDTYLRIGMVCEDDIKYWEHNVNVPVKAAKDRLDSISRAHRQYVGTEPMENLAEIEFNDMQRLQKMFQPMKNGPISRLLRATEKMTIMDCVIPVGVGGTPIYVPDTELEKEKDSELEKEPEPESENKKEPDESATHSRVDNITASDVDTEEFVTVSAC